MTTTRLQGAEEVEALLKGLPEKVAKKVVMSSLRQGGTVLVKEARGYLATHHSIRTGALASQIRNFTVRMPRGGTAQVTVGVGGKSFTMTNRLTGKSIIIKPAKYAKLVEFGTGEHKIVAKDHRPLVFKLFGKKFDAQVVDHPGAKPKPFMRPSVDTKGTAAVDKIVFAMKKGVLREAGKLAIG
jgi:HK97 gp10 family phage protein